MTACFNCGEETKNPKFCSKSCSAKIANKIPKRKKKSNFCIICGIEIKTQRRYCDDHNPQKIDWANVTIQNILETRYGNSNRYNRIREHSRLTYIKSDKPKYCINCGYTKHFAVCHIKPIKDFDKNTPISVVNSLDNLIALCPNCHWEFDKGILKL